MRTKPLSGIKILLFVFFGITVFAPMAFLFMNAGNADIAAIVSSSQFKEGLVNSLLVACCAMIISVTLATLLAFSIERSKMKYKNVFSLILTFPMLIPSISHGMGLVILFGQNGFLTNLLKLESSIYGFGGVVLGSVIYSFPIAFLMMRDVLSYEDCSVYQAADILGIPKINQFLDITLPFLKKPLISIGFSVFTIVITDYGVPLIVGGNFNTLPVVMYEEVIGLLNFEKGSVIGIVLIIPAFITFLIDFLCKDNGVHSFHLEKKKLQPNKLRDLLATVVCSMTSFFVILPIISFALLTFIKKYPIDNSFTFDNMIRVLTMGGGKFLINSIIIAILVSIIGTLMAYVIAYMTARIEGISSRVLHLFSITSMAIPGMVLGLSYALVYKGSFIYGTLIMLVMVNLTHFFSSPYLIAYNSFSKLNINLEAVGVTLGINKFYLVKDILLPQMKGTIAEMLSYFFVNCMMTISAVSFLFTMSNMPIALLINQFESQMQLESAAFVSVIILVVNVIAKLSFKAFSRRESKKEME